MLARITPAESVNELPECGLVIEAVPEDLDLKRRLFADLADRQPSTTVLATNTSSIDIDDIAADVADPERVLGLHFFNPPPVMRLVEVVHGERTARAYVEHAMALMRAWGKTPVRCSSTPGFIVNRVARPFYGEAQRIVEAGVADAATVDWILREHGGFPMGPLELTDFIGQDVNLAVGTSVWEQTGPRRALHADRFQRRLVEAGRLGRKSGAGVYTYAADGAVEGAEPDLELAERLVGGPIATDPLARTLAMLVNEAVDLVARGEASADDVDTAMRLGTRYPEGPDRVGPGDRLRRRGPADRRARRGVPGRALPAEPGPDRREADVSETPAARGGEDGRAGHQLESAGVAFARQMWADDVASRRLGMEAVVIEQDHAVVRMAIRDDMVNGHDICHGGYIFTLADSCFALACNSRGRLTVRPGADISFTAPGRLGDVLVAEGHVRSAFGRSGITDVTVKRGSDSQIVAEFRGRSRCLKRP